MSRTRKRKIGLRQEDVFVDPLTRLDERRAVGMHASKKSGLTGPEEEVMDHLVAAWNAFMALPRDPDRASDDVDEFRHAIHSCQTLIALRSVARAYPQYWTQP